MKRLVAGLALLLALNIAPGKAATTPSSSVVITPPNTILFGLFVNEKKGANAAPVAQLGALERQMGRRAGLSLHFRGFNSKFPGED